MVEGEKKFSNAGSLKAGSYVLIDDEVCQVKSVEKSKPGKHGSAKVRVTAMGLFKVTKKTLLKPTDADVNIPIILKGTAQVVAVMGETIQIMDAESYQTYDIPKPKDVTSLLGGQEIEFIRWGDNIRVIRKK